MKNYAAYVKQSLHGIYGSAVLGNDEKPVSATLKVNGNLISSPISIYSTSIFWVVQFLGITGVFMHIGDTATMTIQGAKGGTLTLSGVAIASGTLGAALARLK